MSVWGSTGCVGVDGVAWGYVGVCGGVWRVCEGMCVWGGGEANA